MTTPATQRKAGPLLGTGLQTAWPFTFKVFTANDVAVTIADSAGVETPLTMGVHYSVALNANQETSPGGTVTYPLSGAALPTGSVLAIVGDIAYDQPLDLPSGGNFSPLAIENQFDRATMQIQQLREEMDRTAKLPPTSADDVASLVDDITRIAGSADNLDTVAENITTVNVVAADLSEPVSEINTVAGSIDNVNAVGGSITNVNTVAAGLGVVTTVASIATDVSTVAGIAADVSTVADVAAAIPTVAAASADIAIVADNVADVTNFADVYLGPSATDPATRKDGSPLQAGDLYFNTVEQSLRAYGGSQWKAGASGTLTPQRLSGDGVETSFTLGIAPSNENSTFVFIDGVYQQKDTYEVVASTLTFSGPPPAGTGNIEVMTISTLALGETDASLVSTIPNDGWTNVQQFITAAANGRLQSTCRFTTLALLRANTATLTTHASTGGYYAQGDGGGSNYYRDASDTTSADNGGSVIVDAIGGRWKLTPHFFGVSVKQFGARCDSSIVGGGTEESAKIQAAVTFANGNFPVLIPAVSLVGTQINCPSETMLYGITKDRSGLVRTPTHSGHTLVMGQVGGATGGAYEVKHLWLRRHITFNGGSSYTPGTSTSIDNKLVEAQAHIYAEQGQRAVIEGCTIDNMPYCIIFVGGSVTELARCHLLGSIYDHTNVGLQEGQSLVWYKAAASGAVPTEMTSRGNDFIGGFGSAARAVTIGSATVTISENVGQQYAIRIDAMEGYASHGDYLGGQNASSVYFNPSSSAICSNIKFNGAFFDGARDAVVRFQHQNAGGIANLVNFSDCIFNGELVSGAALASGSPYNSPVAYDVQISDCKMMGFQLAPVFSSAIVGLHLSDCSISGYHCYGGFNGDPARSAAVYVAGSEYSDKVTFSNLRMGGAVNNLSDTNNCQYGIYCGGTFPRIPVSSGSVNIGLGLAGGALEVGTQNCPQAASLVNSWANYGAGFKSAAFYKDSDGVVHLEGLIANGTMGQVAFTLPAGFRPSGTGNHSTVSNSAAGILVIAASGAVTPNVGSNAWFSLEGISFKAAQ